MTRWNELKERTASLGGQVKTKTEQYRSKDFAEASMAMCALISAADGSITAEEQRKTAALISNNDVLSVFKPEDLRTKFDGYCTKLNRDYDFGKIEAIAAVSKLKSKPDQARAVIAIGLIIGRADGDFDADERAAVSDASYAVGIDPAEFGL